MNLDLARLLVDSGTLVLIWLVQLVIYPGFCFYSEKSLKLWHKKYTPRVSYVVMPLMVGQLFVVLSQLLIDQTSYTIISILVIISLWLSTFLQFVPLHASIAKGTAKPDTPQKLVRRNWIRTFLWSFLFIWSLYWYSVS